MDVHEINNNEIGKSLDALASTVTLSNDPDYRQIAWQNLNSRSNENNLGFDFDEEEHDFDESKEMVIEELKSRISDWVLEEHRGIYGYNYAEAQFKISWMVYNYPDGVEYEQTFIIEVDDSNSFSITDVEFELSNTYIDQFSVYLPFDL